LVGCSVINKLALLSNTECARVVGDGLSQFFNGLQVDLEGVLLQFAAMNIIGGTG